MFTFLLVLSVVLYEGFRLVNMKGYSDLLAITKKYKGGKDKLSNEMTSNPKYVLFSLAETLYVIVMIVILFTPLFALGVYMVLASGLMYVLSKIFKNESIAIRYSDSILTIIVAIGVYLYVS